MTCRPRHGAALAALALVLAGCSGESEEGARRSAGPVSPAFVRLLDEADKAMAKGALAHAGRRLDEARGLAPESPDLWLAIARLRLRGGEHLTAIEAADRALSLGPDYPPALLQRALIVRDAHGTADALSWFEAAREADSGNPDILAEYAAALGDSGQSGAMLEMVRALSEFAPEDPRIPSLQAVLAARGGEYTIARSLLARSRMKERRVPAALMLDALISLEEGNADSAAATLEVLVARQPANARARELLARALHAGGRAGELVQRFAGEAALPEASPYLLMLVARGHEQLGDRAAAAPLLARAYASVHRGPVVLAVREGLPVPTAAARRALLAEKAAGVRSQAEAMRRQFPASADIASLSGDTFLGAGYPQDALAAYALASEVRRPWPLTRKAVWTLGRFGNHAAAELLLARQVAGDTETASAIVALAEKRAAHGDWQRTALLLDHAIALGAGHDPALMRLRLRAAQALGKVEDVRRYAALLAEVQPRKLATR